MQNIEELAAWLLTGQGSAEQVEHLKETGQTKTVRLRKPVTLYFAYVTAWATPDGVIQFRPDHLPKGRGGRGRCGILAFALATLIGIKLLARIGNFFARRLIAGATIDTLLRHGLAGQ